MESVYRSIAGIDVHKKMLAMVLRSQRGDQVQYNQRKFGTNRSDIQYLGAWLQAHGVSEVVMESTAQYWRPVWNGLDRISGCWDAGDLEESFIPGSEQRAWRQTAGTRWDQIVGGGERLVRGERLGHAGTHRAGSNGC